MATRSLRLISLSSTSRTHISFNCGGVAADFSGSGAGVVCPGGLVVGEDWILPSSKSFVSVVLGSIVSGTLETGGTI